MYIYNLGKFRLKNQTDVYYMLFGFIPIKITTIKGVNFLSLGGKEGRLAIFHKIVEGFKLKN
jgi:hypothetical protein